MVDTQTPEPEPPLASQFPKTYYCQRCRRDYVVRSCQAKCNTLLTEVQIICPRCHRKFNKMRLKDWYDHYIHPEIQPPKVDH